MALISLLGEDARADKQQSDCTADVSLEDTFAVGRSCKELLLQPNLKFKKRAPGEENEIKIFFEKPSKKEGHS